MSRRRADRHQSDLIVDVTTIRGGAPGDILTINSHRRLGSTGGGGGGFRTRLLVDTTFFVDANTGNDSNSGLIGFPKLTIPAMVDDLYENYDFGDFDVVLQLTGHFTAGATLPQRFVGQSVFTIQGNPADVKAVRIDLASSDKCIEMIGGSAMTLQDVTCSNSVGDAIFVDELSYLTYGNLRVEDTAGQMFFWGGGSHHLGISNKTVTIAGNADRIFHHTGKARVSFEDVFLVFEQNPNTLTWPTGTTYLCGGNDSSISFNRCKISGQKSGQITEHFGGIMLHDPDTGNMLSDFYHVGQVANTIDTGGAIYFANPALGTFYVGSTGNDLSEGYTAALPILNFSTAISRMQARLQTMPQPLAPVLQVNDATYSASIILLDIPGVPIATCKGNSSTPANCVVKAIQNRAVSTKWIIDGFTFSNPTDEHFHGLSNSNTSLQNCVFAVADATKGQIIADQNAYVDATGPLSVTGNAGNFINNSGGQVIITQTVTFVGAITYARYTVESKSDANTRWTGTKTGSVTGTRVNLTNGAFLDSNHPADQSAIPGTVDGIVDAGTFAQMV